MKCIQEIGGGKHRYLKLGILKLDILNRSLLTYFCFQKTLPDGDTLILLIFFSDSTHLTNFCGDKKAWPVYMTIGNLSSNIRMKPTTHSILLVALLPQPMKLRDIPACQRVEQRTHNRKVMQSVLHFLLHPLTDQDTWQFIGYCADGHYRKCHLVLSGWVADYPEHVALQNHGYGLRPWCEVTKDKLGDLINTSSLFRDHRLYKALYDIAKYSIPDSFSRKADPAMQDSNDVVLRMSNSVENRNSTISSIMNIIRDISNDRIEAAAILKQHGMNLGDNILWYTGSIVSELPKPDLLHTMDLGMLKHLLIWLQQFMKKFKRLDRYNELWLSVPAYLTITKPTKSYEEIIRWTGTELRTIARYLLAIVTNTLRSPGVSEKNIFDQVIQCSRALLEFYQYCIYSTHDEKTLRLMDEALNRFHVHKSVFLQFRAHKKVTEHSRELLKQYNAERDLDLENYHHCTEYQWRLQLNEWNE
jgi:hypothetical protein